MDARVLRTVCICLQGAAHCAEKEMMRRVDEGREATWEWYSSSVLISVRVDIVYGMMCECEEWFVFGSGSRSRYL